MTLKDTNSLGNNIFQLYRFISFFLAILSFFLIKDFEFLFLSILVNILFLFLNWNKKYKEIPGMILISFTSILYFQVPVLFLGHKYDDFNFGAIIRVPNDNQAYLDSAIPGILYFLCAFLIMIFGILCISYYKKMHINNVSYYQKINISVLVFFAFIIFFSMVKDVQAIFDARVSGEAKAESFFSIIFNDKSYQLIFPIIFYSLNVEHKQKKYYFSFLFVVLLFLSFNLFGASKASIIIIFTFFFLTPLALYYPINKTIYWPSKFLYIVGIIISIPLFYLSMIQRELGVAGSMPTFKQLYSIVLIISGGNNEVSLFDPILYRLTVNLTNFIAIFHEFTGKYSLSYSLHMSNYTFNSLLNVILPGTPYPNNYVLTSQLLPAVLDKNELYSSLGKGELLKQANTQPYNIFGFFYLVFGSYLTLVLSFLFGFCFAKLYFMISNHIYKVFFLFSFGILYHCYGFESAVQYILMTVITSIILIKMMNSVSSFFRQ